MKLYSKKQRWKKILLFSGIGIIGIIFWLTSTLVSNVKRSELEKIGLESTETIPGNLKLLPISLDLSEGYEYWIGFDNYQSISRYNRSKLYIMAVFEFSNALSKFL